MLVLRTVRNDSYVQHGCYSLRPFPTSPKYPSYVNAVIEKMQRSNQTMIDELQMRIEYQHVLDRAYFDELYQALTVAAKSESCDACVAIAETMSSDVLLDDYAAPFRKALQTAEFLNNDTELKIKVAEEALKSNVSRETQLNAEMVVYKDKIRDRCAIYLLTSSGLIMMVPPLVFEFTDLLFWTTYGAVFINMFMTVILLEILLRRYKRRRSAEIFDERLNAKAVYEKLLPDTP